MTSQTIKEKKKINQCEWNLSGTFEKYNGTAGTSTFGEKRALVVCSKHGEVKEVKVIVEY